MSRRIVPLDGVYTAKRGTAFLYVFPCAYEDLAKLGMSGDPMARLQTFSHRYYEFFDLAQGWLVEAESIKEARRWETHWKRLLREHAAPAPLLIPKTAAGHTEWFRGALEQLQQAQLRFQEQGFHVHSLIDWVRIHVGIWRDELDGLERGIVSRAGDVDCWPDAAISPELGRLRDGLDACVALSLSLDAVASPALRRWHRRNSLSQATGDGQ